MTNFLSRRGSGFWSVVVHFGAGGSREVASDLSANDAIITALGWDDAKRIEFHQGSLAPIDAKDVFSAR